MNPVLAAWLPYVARLAQMPPWTCPTYPQWLADCEALSDWFNTVRRLQY